MGQYGYGIMDSDDAFEYREEFFRKLMSGKSMRELVIEELKEDRREEQFFALVHFQLLGDKIHTTAKEWVLKYINYQIEEGCTGWDEPEERIKILREFKSAIEEVAEWGEKLEVDEPYFIRSECGELYEEEIEHIRRLSKQFEEKTIKELKTKYVANPALRSFEAEIGEQVFPFGEKDKEDYFLEVKTTDKKLPVIFLEITEGRKSNIGVNPVVALSVAQEFSNTGDYSLVIHVKDEDFQLKNVLLNGIETQVWIKVR